MGYEIHKLAGDTYKEKISNYDYALVYMISEMILCPVKELTEPDWSECQEARFFSDTGEMHLFEGENGMEAVEVRDTDPNNILVKAYEINGKFSATGKKILVQEYLSYDEDGQADVALTRLKGILLSGDIVG